MKRIFFSKAALILPSVLTAAAITLTVLAGCEHPFSTGGVEATDLQKFTGIIFSGSPTKTLLGDEVTEGNVTRRSVLWRAGDVVVIGGTTFTATQGGSTTTTLSGNGAQPEGGVYKAYYPSVIYNDGTPSLPATQYYVPGGIDNLPMYAESSSTTLTFQNLCSVLEIKLIGDGTKSVGTIEVSSTEDKKLNGSFALEWNGGSDMVVLMSGSPSESEKKVTLNCLQNTDGAGVQLTAAGQSFFVAIPSQEYTSGKLKVAVKDVSGAEIMSFSSKKNTTLDRSTIYEVKKNTVGFGPFSVSEDKQVWFAPGNVLFKATKSGGTYINQHWEFAEHQWDVYYTGPSGWNIVPGLIGADYVADGLQIYDHFGWATAGNGIADETHVNYQPWTANAASGVNSNNYYGYGPYSTPSSWVKNGNLPYGVVKENTWRGSDVELNCEWGIHFDDNGNERQVPATLASYSRTWYTLSACEWDYVFTKRLNAVNLWGDGRIYVDQTTYINGIILLPDSWELPQGCAFVSGLKGYESEYNRYFVSASASAQGSSGGSWEKMEAAGAVFLPAAGNRGGWIEGAGANSARMFNSGNSHCSYWSSSHSDFDQLFGGVGQGAYAYALNIVVNKHDPSCRVSGASTFDGGCVRLVHD